MYFPDGGVRTPLTPLVWLRHCYAVIYAANSRTYYY